MALAAPCSRLQEQQSIPLHYMPRGAAALRDAGPSVAVVLPGSGDPACGIFPAAPAAGPLAGAPFPGAMGQGRPTCTAAHSASGPWEGCDTDTEQQR